MKHLLLRSLVSVGVAIATAFVVALAVTIVDLYLVGHGYPSINREVLLWPGGGVSLSPAGILLLLCSFGAGGATWFFMRRPSGSAAAPPRSAPDRQPAGRKRARPPEGGSQ
ncbi:MAG: hypothetical protein FDZ69_12010 [Deltaproteobacteria bacterium]|nr:MAG: hypothetical protein FDZ69_12010 [Deltaproteobacteria bacterium]